MSWTGYIPGSIVREWNEREEQRHVSPPARLLVTGSRNFPRTRTYVIADALSEAITMLRGEHNREVVVVHGHCPSGADMIADELVRGWGIPVERHPAIWSMHGSAAGPIRNGEMVALGADLVLAFPLASSAGTRDCVEQAQRAGLEVKVIEE